MMGGRKGPSIFGSFVLVFRPRRGDLDRDGDEDLDRRPRGDFEPLRRDGFTPCGSTFPGDNREEGRIGASTTSPVGGVGIAR